MPRNKSYAESMNEWAEEKKFLRKFRPKAFHPDYESPLAARLFGYLIRLVIFCALAALVLLARNKSYFSGQSFRDSLKREMDYCLAADSSQLEKVSWKNGRGSTNYKAQGGPLAFFKELEAKRVRFSGNWWEMLSKDAWNLRDIEIGELRLALKGGSTAKGQVKEYARASSWLTATPNFAESKFGDIKLGAAEFSWGPHWSSMGGLKEGAGTLRREDGGWKLELNKGLLEQNWLKGLRLDPALPLKILRKDHKLVLQQAKLRVGQAGEGTLEGVITLGETPIFDLAIDLKTVRVEEILPEEFHEYFTGVGDLVVKIKGSTNSAEGILTEGSFTVVEKGRVREIPILRTLAVVSGKAELRSMPLGKSRIDFSTRKGVMTIRETDLVSGDIAKVKGSFTYHLDTRGWEKGLTEVKPPLPGEPQPKGGSGDYGFRGQLQVGMPWELLGEESFRKAHFTPDENGWGWLTVAMTGPMKDVTDEQANIMDRRLADLTKSSGNPFEDRRPRPAPQPPR